MQIQTKIIIIIFLLFLSLPVFSQSSDGNALTPHVTELTKEEENKTGDIDFDGILNTNSPESNINVIREILAPLDTGEVIHTIPTPGPSGQGLTWDGNYLWNSDKDTDIIYKLSPVNGTVLNSFPAPGDFVEGLAWDGTYLWAAENGGSTANPDKIYQLDPSNGSVIHLYTPANLDWPHGITWDGQYLWVNNFQTKLLDKVDPFTGQVLASIPAPGNGSVGLTWDGQYLWSDDFNTDLLYQIDPSDGTIIRTVPSPHTNPRDLAWDGQYLWIVSWQADTIYQVDVGYTTSIINEKLYPKGYILYPNYPNPFNPATKINFQIPELCFVSLKVYDVLGKDVATLVNEEKPVGSYELEFDAATLPSGIYFYQLKAGNFVETKKMVLMK